MQPNSPSNEVRGYEIAFLILLVAAWPLHAQVNPEATPPENTTAYTAPALSIPSGKQIQIPALGASSAVSLDLHIAEVQLENGSVLIRAIDVGDTLIVLLGESELQQISIHVVPGPPMFPPGFIPPQDIGNQTGSYELRYSSDRQQFENSIDLSSRSAPGETTQIHLVTATYTAVQTPTTFVPSAFYRITAQDKDLTLLDQTVNESPLTLQNVTVRGIHFRDGDWRFHAGYTTSATFADVLIPTEKEFAAGVSHSNTFGDFLTVTPGVYFLRSIDLATGLQRSAFVGSLRLNADLPSDWHLQAEAGESHNLAYSGQLRHESDVSKIYARIMDRKLDFPALRTSALPGLNGEFSWTQMLTSRLALFSGGSISDVDLNNIQQDSQNGFVNLRYKLTHSWSVTSGVSYGLFKTVGQFSAQTLTLPQQINFDRTHFGAGFEYQFATASDSFSNGSGLRQTMRGSFGRFQIGEYVDLQRDALSVSALFSELPALQIELQKLGISSITPDQLAILLQDAAFLQSLGLSGSTQIVTVPRRVQEGGDLSWSSNGIRPHQLSLAVIENHNQYATYNSHEYSFTGAYSKQLSPSNQMQLSWSLVKSDMNGSQVVSPLVSASFRHIFSHASPHYWKQKDDNLISGVVFIDSRRRGEYETGMEVIPKVTVILDGVRTASTDANGHFRFAGLSAGNHRVELQYRSEREHYFTSPQDTVATGGATVNFGVAFPKTDLWGYVEDDAGNGLANVKLEIVGASGAFTASTDRSGKFIVPDVQSGSYHLAVDPESIAFGYSTEDLAPIDVNMSASSFVHPVVKIPAVRVLTGTVTVYSPEAQRYIPVKGAEISIAKLERHVSTNATGRFLLAGLPAGDVEIKVVAGESSATHMVNMPVHPSTLHEDFKISSLTGEIVFSIASSTP